jgi:hypothetical protein
MTFQYDADSTALWVLTRIRGTALKAVFLKPFFWILLFIHGCLLAVDRVLPYDDASCASMENTTCDQLTGDYLQVMNWSAIGTLTGFLVRHLDGRSAHHAP